MDLSKIVCNNCGIRGHLYKDCRNPVLSYGVLLFSCENLKNIQDPKILMIQRKDSLCYIEFLRGKYDLNHPRYIQILVDKFSVSEKDKVLSQSFETLWKELWMLGDAEECPRFRGDYQKGHDKFERVKQGIYCGKETLTLRDFVKKSETSYKDSEWEFPKGRRESGESNKTCAIREFSEETTYDSDDYELFTNIAPLDEEFVGENRVRYKHVYYIGYLKNLSKDVSVLSTNRDQITEIKDIRWVSESEAYEMIRDYHHTRREVIQQMFRLIHGLNRDYFIVG